MSDIWYRGAGTRADDGKPVELPESPIERYNRPDGYIADKGLADAVNIALHLGQPLLLTGEPGTGKTQLAYSLAWELNYGLPLKFETKSTSTARDLFYGYDALSHLQASQAGAELKTLDFIRWNAMGEAILRANDPADVADIYQPEGGHEQKSRSVVLIDEIDKAPRDFPNDLLSEMEGMYFRIPELDNRRVDASLRPVLILTSNSEKNLPAAFLRRCVFYYIPFPEDKLADIVTRRLGEQVTRDPTLLRDALNLFAVMRNPANGLIKKPSTGEFLAWLHVLTDRAGVDQTNFAPVSLKDPLHLQATLCTLVKLKEDRDRAEPLIKAWQQPG